MKRHEWSFQRKASDLAAAAKERADHHETRIEWWQKKYDDTMAKVKASGISVHEPVTNQYSNLASGILSLQPEVRVDETLQRDLSECHIKLADHDKRRREYLGWVQCLSKNPDAVLELHCDDFLFFFPEA